MSSPPCPSVSTSTFPFLALPSELRTNIYRFVLLSEHDSVQPTRFKKAIRTAPYHNLPAPPTRNDRESHYPPPQLSSPASRRTNLDILLICRQILAEAELIWYAETQFMLHLSQAIQFFDSLGERRRAAITCVEVCRVASYHLAEKPAQFWMYLERTRTLIEPRWFVVGLSGNHTNMAYLERTMEQILEGLPSRIRQAPGGIHRCGLPPSTTFWDRGGNVVTDVAPWMDREGLVSSASFTLRLGASGFGRRERADTAAV